MSAVLFPGQGDRDLRAVVRGLDGPLIDRAGGWADDGSNLQPLTVAAALTILRSKSSAVRCFAGHSLGELTAAAAAGALTFEAAVDLARLRGRLMADAAALAPGGMVAIERDAVPIALAVEGIQIAAYNGPNQVVVSGPEAALRRVAACVRGTRLRVDGPWHSAAMDCVRAPLHAALNDVVEDANTPLIRGVDGLAVTAAADIVDGLVRLLTEPVDWVAVCESLGLGPLIVVGPGRSLRGLLRQNCPNAEITLVVSRADPEAA